MEKTFVSNRFNSHDWISSIKANDQNALKELYAQNFEKIRVYILCNKGTEADVKDIFQEAFLAFWRNVQLDKFEVLHTNAIQSYLLRIAKNKWIDHLRKRKRIIVSEDVGVEDLDQKISADFSIEEEEYYEKIKIQFSKMGNPCKELLYRFYYRREKLKAIAVFFEWKESTAKNNKYRCLQKLRKSIITS